ncbi:type II toxin-antitoxin system RelE/ParE family toxin [Escherichia coli]|nr:type II toxin-antitoxin system RelE/ParE family toxin [Escherichia coli]
MRTIKLMPKANEDLEGIWYYSYHHFGEPQADRYVEHLSDVLQILSNNNIGTPRPELGEGIFVLPFERHVIYFLQSPGNDSNLLIVFYVQIMPDDFVMQLHRF